MTVTARCRRVNYAPDSSNHGTGHLPWNTRSSIPAIKALMGAIIGVAILTILIIHLAQLVVPSFSIQERGTSSPMKPIPCHSHNDFWRQSPLRSAIDAGCIGVEADVWPVRGQLLVGHRRDALSIEATFQSLYIDPLKRDLRSRDPASEFSADSTYQGLYDYDQDQTLVLLVDVKTEPAITWPLLLESLEPIRERGWLSHRKNDTVISRPVTVLVTGKMPKFLLRSPNIEVPSHIFFDAPLSQLSNGFFDTSNSHWASDSFFKQVGHVWLLGLQQHHIQRIRGHVLEARSRGLKSRYWGLPSWPPSLRDRVWQTLLSEGVDIINVDNLAGVTGSLSRLKESL